MGKIESGNIHTGLDHLPQSLFVVGGRADRTNDLRLFHDVFSLSYDSIIAQKKKAG
jgi:hypothetical protein